jgi:hypothetical protein
MIKLQKTIIVPVAPIYADGALDISELSGIIFRNAGTATVNLFNGLYTLDPKETLSLNVTEKGGFFNLDSIPVTFDTGTGSAKLLQIIAMKQNLFC